MPEVTEQIQVQLR